MKHNSELKHPFEFPGYDIKTWTVVEGQNLIRIDKLPDPTSGGSAQTARSGAPAAVSYLAPGTVVTFYGNVTLKAEWTKLPAVTLTYHANGGAPDPDSVPNKGQAKEYNSGDTVTVEDGSGLTKGTQKFRYWSTTPNDTTGSQQYTAGKTFAINKNTDLYAIYEDAPSGGGDKEYTVTYDPNGGTGTTPTDSNKYKGGETVKVKDKWNLVRTNGTFKEWNTKKDGSGTGYKGDGTDTFTMPASDVTPYAIWTDSNGNIMPSPGTGESDLPLLIAFNMAMISLLAGAFVVMKQQKWRKENAS